jgi:hypothetical protein
MVFPPRVFFLLLSAGLMLAAAGPACADGQVPPKTVRVPVASPSKAEAVRGIPVEIRISGITGTGRKLDFILRQGPRHGKLDGPPVPETKDTAVVRYTADPGSTAVEDGFSFGVKVEGSGASADAEVKIGIIEPAPVLEAPAGLDLGRVLAREVEERTISIFNKGNMAFQAVVPLPEGWAWLEPAGGRFDLPVGQRMEAVLRVRTSGVGPIDHKIMLLPNTAVRVIGRTLPPFLGHPSLLRLQWERGTDRRSYQFTVQNNRPEPITVRLTAPPELKVPESVTVPVAESVRVPVVSTGGLQRALSGKIRLEGPGWIQELEFEAIAAPALVEITGASPEGKIDFGVLENAVESKAVRRLTLTNVGGTTAVVHAVPLGLFLVEGLEEEMVLPPQTKREITLRPDPKHPGRLKENLILQMTGGDRTLEVLADIDPEAAKAELMSGVVLQTTPPPRADGTEPLTAPKITAEGLRTRVAIFTRGIYNKPLPNTDPTLPIVTGETVRLVREEPERIIFEWNAPGPGTWTYQVLVRMLRTHSRKQAPIPEYDQMDNVKVTSTPTGGRAEVTKLRPGSRWMCAIVGIRGDGKATRPGEDLTFLIPYPQQRRWMWPLLGVLGAVSLVLYVRQKWREDVKW